MFQVYFSLLLFFVCSKIDLPMYILGTLVYIIPERA